MQQSYVEMKAVTWQKDSHGLFDYETQLLTVKKYKIEKESQVFRHDQEITIQDLKDNIQQDQQYLTSITAKEDSFFIQPRKEDKLCLDNENYLIVRSLKNSQGAQKGYKLEPGDVIKLGRMEYVIIETKDKAGNVQLAHGEARKDWFEMMAEPVQETCQPQCKICLFEKQTEDDPFISPCQCKGTCQYVHFNCLKQWIDSRSQSKKQNGAITYKWKKLECEVCGTSFPQKITILEKQYCLAEIERPQGPYLIMQSTIKDKKSSKGVYVIQCSELLDGVKLGRGHQCDIRISDISVSRLHAFIKYEDGNFIIIDNNSKFGTLVKMNKKFEILSDKVAVQIGRTVLTFVMKQEKRPTSQV